MRFILFMIIWIGVLSIVGCNDEAIKEKHPVAVAIAKDAAKDVSDALEPVIDTELHLPSGTTKIVVEDIEKIA